MSIGDISLTAGMRDNLVALQNTANLVQTTQQALSTGKKVNSAIDNPMEFFASQDMLNQANSLASYNDGMSNGIQTIQAANEGITGINSLIEQAQSLAQSAVGQTDATQYSLYQQYSNVMTQITNMAGDAGFQGINLLGTSSNTLTVNFGSTSGDDLVVNGAGADATTLKLVDASDSSNSASKGWQGLTADTTALSTALSTLQTQSQTLSSSLAVITARQSFTTNMINVLQTGSDNLVLADTNEEGANMLMLQTQQSLGTTALSLASQSAQSVLKLFG
ncbi:MAG: flagellin [Dissulfurispiraceae bacterium]